MDKSYEALLGEWHAAENAAVHAEQLLKAQGQLAADPRAASLASDALERRQAADNLFEQVLAHEGFG